MGAVDYGRFRLALGPMFTVPEADRDPSCPSNLELRDALKAYVDLAPMGNGAPFATVERAAQQLAAIAIARRDHADNPDARHSAVMRILHSRRAAS